MLGKFGEAGGIQFVEPADAASLFQGESFLRPAYDVFQHPEKENLNLHPANLPPHDDCIPFCSPDGKESNGQGAGPVSLVQGWTRGITGI